MQKLIRASANRSGRALGGCGTASKCRATDRGHHMKMLLSVAIPHEPFNSLVRNGKAGEVIGHILETIRPEAAYFTEQDGTRGGIFVVDVKSPFLNFQANCKFRILMSPEDLKKAGLEAIGKKWA